MNAEKKQAVVLIHGVGEQVPMDTLRGFVEAVWTTDLKVRRSWTLGKSWSKPDQISGDFELRRVTTTENRERRRTDFFEFYWAHLMQGTSFSHLGAWAKVLLFRRPSRVPGQLLGIWWTLAVMAVIAIAVAVCEAVGLLVIPKSLLAWGSSLWLVIGGSLTGLLINVAGDAARYLHVAPGNIAIRSGIRQAGIDLLEKLHASGEYDRIILVGHSLGSVIGYDILTHLWPRYNAEAAPEEGKRVGDTAQKALEKLAAVPGAGKLDVDEYQKTQSAYFDELQSRAKKWLVSDFVTLGSPLSHATVLMARNEEELAMKKAHREFPTCPPILEVVKGAERFTYRDRAEAPKEWRPNHAAVFAPTRWTNLYFPCRWTMWGDVIGGPVAPVFGPGIRDVPVATDLRGGVLAHTLYWSLPKVIRGAVPSCITELRKAVRLCQTQPRTRSETEEE